MAWAVPNFERKDVDAAGKKLALFDFPVTSFEGLGVLAVINNWRSAHSYPLNTFQITLRNKARKIEKNVIVAQRIKRLESIHAKLARQPSMRMSQMQDIAGCRAVFKSMANVRRLVEKYKSSKFEHSLKGEKNYIAHPKPDGYRCHHLVYVYKGTPATQAYDGLQGEIQIRTQMQHAWATAVEAVGIFTEQALKSSQGNEDWLRFFALMGAAIAAIEQCNPVPDTPTDKQQLIDEIEALAAQLHVGDMLTMYNTTIEAMGSAKDAKYFLVQLDFQKRSIVYWQYKALQSEEANSRYTEIESKIPDGSGRQVVLVAVENITALKRAYPNYFLDTNMFGALVTRVLSRDIPDPLPHQTTAGAA